LAGPWTGSNPVGDTIHVKFGEPGLADSVVRGQIHFQQSLNSCGDRLGDPHDIPVFGRRQRIEAWTLSRQSRINAIGTDHVSMGMEIQCRTEPLYERDRSALAAWNTALGCAFAHGLEDDAGEDSHHSGQQIGVIRHAVTQAVGD